MRDMVPLALVHKLPKKYISEELLAQIDPYGRSSEINKNNNNNLYLVFRTALGDAVQMQICPRTVDFEKVSSSYTSRCFLKGHRLVFLWILDCLKAII